ncbi:MAG: DUF5666 domain-containing protein [Nitrospirota bacterium]|nr:DUF5666 domain-containing protein [Nitrospirota bacterium]
MKKTLIIGLLAGLVMSLTAETGMAGEHERHQGQAFEHNERYESKIYGTVEKLPAGLIGIWQVKGREISVTKDTFIKEKHGKAAVGAYVEIEGTYQDKTLVARKIEVKRAKADGGTDRHESRERHEGRERGHNESYKSKIYGTVEKMPEGLVGTWQVKGREISVTKDTLIKEKHGKAAVGAYVEIEGTYQDKTLVARKIEVKRAR